MNNSTKKVLRWYDDKKELFEKRDALTITKKCLERFDLKNEVDVEYYTLLDAQHLGNIMPTTNQNVHYDTHFLLMDVDWSTAQCPDSFLQNIIIEIENDNKIMQAYIIFYSCVYDKKELKERTQNISLSNAKCEIIGYKCMYSGTKGLLKDSMMSVCQRIKEIIDKNEGRV